MLQSGRAREVHVCRMFAMLSIFVFLSCSSMGGAETVSNDDTDSQMGTLHRLRIFIATSIADLSAEDHARFDALLGAVSFLWIPCAACMMGYYLQWSCCPGERPRASWCGEESEIV